jgi:hypothetical protein
MGTGLAYSASSVVSMARRSAAGRVKLKTEFGTNELSEQFEPAA